MNELLDKELEDPNFSGVKVEYFTPGLFENKIFSLWSWQHRKEFGTPDGKRGFWVALDSIFPFLSWVLHPIRNWKYRNSFMIIPGVNDKSCDDLNCGNKVCAYLREEGK